MSSREKKLNSGIIMSLPGNQGGFIVAEEKYRVVKLMAPMKKGYLGSARGRQAKFYTQHKT